MRKKKKELSALKLNAKPTEQLDDEDPKDNKKFDAIFENLMKNFEAKKQEFEELKKMDDG